MIESNESAETILAVFSRRVFAAGPHAVTIDAVIQELGISKKTVYKYFNSKESLLWASLEQLNRNLGDQIDAILEANPQPREALAQIQRLVATTLSHLSEAFVTDVGRHYPDLWRYIERFRTRYIQMLKPLIQAGMDQGDFRPMPPDLLIEVWQTAVTATMTPEGLRRLKMSMDEVFHTIQGLLQNGYVLPPSSFTE